MVFLWFSYGISSSKRWTRNRAPRLALRRHATKERTLREGRTLRRRQGVRLGRRGLTGSFKASFTYHTIGLLMGYSCAIYQLYTYHTKSMIGDGICIYIYRFTSIISYHHLSVPIAWQNQPESQKAGIKPTIKVSERLHEPWADWWGPMVELTFTYCTNEPPSFRWRHRASTTRQ